MASRVEPRDHADVAAAIATASDRAGCHGQSEASRSLTRCGWRFNRLPVAPTHNDLFCAWSGKTNRPVALQDTSRHRLRGLRWLAYRIAAKADDGRVSGGQANEAGYIAQELVRIKSRMTNWVSFEAGADPVAVTSCDT